MTLVWLKTPVFKGTKGMPKAKLYAKWDTKAKRNSRPAYFFMS